MVLNLYVFVNKMDGMSGGGGGSGGASAGVVETIKTALADPIRLTIGDIDAGEDNRPRGPKLTLLRGGLDDAKE